jgi:hypothetical protein
MQKQLFDISEAEVGELLECTKRGDTEAMGRLISLFSPDIENLSRKATRVGIPSDEAKQIIITNFLERMVAGKI